MFQEGWQSSNIQILNAGALDACLALIFTGPVLQQRLAPTECLEKGMCAPGLCGCDACYRSIRAQQFLLEGPGVKAAHLSCLVTLLGVHGDQPNADPQASPALTQPRPAGAALQPGHPHPPSCWLAGEPQRVPRALRRPTAPSATRPALHATACRSAA